METLIEFVTNHPVLVLGACSLAISGIAVLARKTKGKTDDEAVSIVRRIVNKLKGKK